MSPLTLLDTVFLKPLLSLYESMLAGIFSFTNDAGWTLIFFGIALNLALTPVYYQMVHAGRERDAKRAAMNAEIERITKHYKGRERYFYVQTIHRQFGYNPLSVVLSSGDLYLQVLIFGTVYRYLAHHPALIGARFLSIPDLSKPDGLLLGVNLLPLLMTLFNGLSAMLHVTDRAKLRSALVLAGLFLVLLYRSPSGLVLYWTTNNAFSLVRNFLDRVVVARLPSAVRQRLHRLASQE